MKKIVCILFLAIFFLTACDANRISITPTGIQLRPPVELEIDDEYEYYLELLPIDAPTAITREQDSVNVLRLSMRHPLTLNPLLNEDVTVARILRLIFEPLIILDDNFRPTSHLAEIEMTADFSSARLEIRSDAFWSDGRPVTSDDIIFSVETLRNAPPRAVYRDNVENIAAITRVNARTVQVHFHQASMDAGISLNFPIIPRHYYQNQNNPRSVNNMNPLGNAPFLFESYTPMQNITLVQNPQSFRQLSQIEKIEVIFLPDAQTELYAFDQGRIDAIYLPLTEWVRHHSVRHPGYEIFPAMYFEFIGFNMQNEIFQNIYMRQGVAHAFNADEAVSAVYLNHGVRTASPIHPYSFVSSNVNGAAYNAARARALLNAVSIARPVIIIANEDNPQRVSIAESLAASLNAVGTPARALIVHYEEYFTRLEDGDFDLFVGGVNLAFSPDVEFFFSGGFYLEDYVLSEAFAAIKTAVTEDDYLQAVRQFQQTFAERLPVISLVFRHSSVLTNRRVVQHAAPPADNIFGQVNLWTFV